MVAHHARGVIKTSLHISASETGVFLQHVLNGITGNKKFQHRLYRNACAANHRSPIANIRLDGNVLMLAQLSGNPMGK